MQWSPVGGEDPGEEHRRPWESSQQPPHVQRGGGDREEGCMRTFSLLGQAPVPPANSSSFSSSVVLWAKFKQCKLQTSWGSCCSTAPWWRASRLQQPQDTHLAASQCPLLQNTCSCMPMPSDDTGISGRSPRPLHPHLRAGCYLHPQHPLSLLGASIPTDISKGPSQSKPQLHAKSQQAYLCNKQRCTLNVRCGLGA